MGTLRQRSHRSLPDPCITAFTAYSGGRTVGSRTCKPRAGEGEIALQLRVGPVERKLGSPGFLQLRLPQLLRATIGASPELRGRAETRSDNLNAMREQGTAKTPRAVPGEAATVGEDEKEGSRAPPPPTKPSAAAATSRDTMARTRPPRDGGAQRRQRRPARGKPCHTEPGYPSSKLEKHPQNRNGSLGASQATLAVHPARLTPSARKQTRTSSRRSSKAATLEKRTPVLVAAVPVGALEKVVDGSLPEAPRKLALLRSLSTMLERGKEKRRSWAPGPELKASRSCFLHAPNTPRLPRVAAHLRSDSTTLRKRG
jgi:hypothetical protein